MGLRQDFEADKLPMFDISKAQAALPKIEKGLKQYASLMERIRDVNVSQNRQFQKDYNSFFGVRQRAARFYAEYYQFMEDHKNDNKLTFEATLRYLFDKTERVEALFSSKLLSVVNPKMPIWDFWVLKNLRLKVPSAKAKDRIRKTVDLYAELCSWYKGFFKTEEAKKWTEMFDALYPKAQGIPKVKKIDLILWQIRD